ncbi:MAG TPA: HAMP domain-containing sensor histidine kinase [Micromonosporaceae bacterium]|nr:HAMP domain-containing sensor histidine kinase [Micromonosporaceae bacterium]
MDDRRGAAATVAVPATGSATSSGSDGTLPGAVLLSKLGHELRSPLTGIVGLTRIMLLKLVDGSIVTAQQIHQLELMRTSAVQMLDTVDRVVAITKLDAVTSPPGSAFDCRTAITTVAVQAKPSADAHARRLIVEVPDEPVMMIGHEDALQRLLTELVDNAIKYTDQTDIRIRCHLAAHRSPVIEVSDGGPGITAEEQTSIFAPFFRGAAAEHHDVSGSGLGLYLAQQLTDRCGTTLTVHSTPSTGSTFVLRLNPLAISATATTSR